MSSDSDDDCYSNIAKKLQSMKSNYPIDKTSNILDSSIDLVTTNNLTAGDRAFPALHSLNQAYSGIGDTAEVTLDSIIEQNSKKRKTRTRKKKNDDRDIYVPEVQVGRGRTRSSKRISSQRDDSLANHLAAVVSQARASVADGLTRTSNRGTPSQRRGRGRGRGRGQSRQRQAAYSPYYYSVGNTDEYEDLSEKQEIFSAKPSDVIVIDDNLNDTQDDPLDENEELSVKVYWRSSEIVKFTIRRFQKFTQIFDYFASKENVEKEKLFFTYNDKILNADDTPDGVNYNIGKFIDGGIVNRSLSPLKKKCKYQDKNGIKLKFQCQNVKKPFEAVIDADKKLLVAFMKCAEHLEKPLEKLKFHFDGDLISGKNTAKDLELEGGECIDVTVS